MGEKTKLITQLRDAKNLIEQLEQDKVNKNFYIKFSFGRRVVKKLRKNKQKVIKLLRVVRRGVWSCS